YSVPSAVLRTTACGLARVLLPFVLVSALFTAIDTAYYLGPFRLTEVAVALNHYLHIPTVDSVQHTVRGHVHATVAYSVRAWVLPVVIWLGECLESAGVGRVGASVEEMDMSAFAGVWQWIVLTPLNGLSYNLDTANLATHGLHSRATHLVTNMPMLYGPLALTLLYVTVRALSVCALSVRVGRREGSRAWQRLAVTVLPPAVHLEKRPLVLQHPGLSPKKPTNTTPTQTPINPPDTRTRTRSRASQGRESTSTQHTHTDYTRHTNTPRTINETVQSVLTHRSRDARAKSGDIDRDRDRGVQSGSGMHATGQGVARGCQEESVDDVLRGIGSLTLDTSAAWRQSGKDGTAPLQSTHTHTYTHSTHSVGDEGDKRRNPRTTPRVRASGKSPALTLNRDEIGTYDDMCDTSPYAPLREHTPLRGHSRSVHAFVLTFLLACVWVPLAVLSVQPHQEARFLLPLVTPMMLLTATPYFQTSLAIPTFVLFNGVVGAMYGYIHQAGVVPSLVYLRDDIHTTFEVTGCEDFTAVYYHTYMPPRFLYLSTGETPYTSTLDDLKGADVAVLSARIHEWVTNGNEDVGGRYGQDNTPVDGKFGPVLERVRRDVHRHTPRSAAVRKTEGRQVRGYAHTDGGKHTDTQAILHAHVQQETQPQAQAQGRMKQDGQEHAHTHERRDGGRDDGADRSQLGKGPVVGEDRASVHTGVDAGEGSDVSGESGRDIDPNGLVGVHGMGEANERGVRDGALGERKERYTEASVDGYSEREVVERDMGVDGQEHKELPHTHTHMHADIGDAYTHTHTHDPHVHEAYTAVEDVHESYVHVQGTDAHTHDVDSMVVDDSTHQHYTDGKWDTGGGDEQQGQVMSATDNGPCRTLYVVLPSTVEAAIYTLEQNPDVNFTLQRDFFPHFSGEDIPPIDPSELLAPSQNGQKNVLRHFSLRVYKATAGDCAEDL
ncbi:hypothetical protein SARC_10456, partial [Sphaeroforma arctica JP610]